MNGAALHQGDDGIGVGPSARAVVLDHHAHPGLEAGGVFHRHLGLAVVRVHRELAGRAIALAQDSIRSGTYQPHIASKGYGVVESVHSRGEFYGAAAPRGRGLDGALDGVVGIAHEITAGNADCYMDHLLLPVLGGARHCRKCVRYRERRLALETHSPARPGDLADSHNSGASDGERRQ